MSEMNRAAARAARAPRPRPWPGAVGLLVTVLALAACGAPREVGAQEYQTVTSARGSSGQERLRVDVEYGAGQLRIQPAQPGVLYRSSLRYDTETFRPVTSFSNGRLRVGLEGHTKRIRKHNEARLDLALGPDVPLDVDLAFGAVEADIELGGLRVRSFKLSTGASETELTFSAPNRERINLMKLEAGAAALRVTGLGNANAERLDFDGGVGDIHLDFSGTWTQDMHASVDMGLGELTLVIPRELGVRVMKDTFLMSFDSEGLTRRGGAYYSANWDSAPHKLTVDINGALGSINVRWRDGVASR